MSETGRKFRQALNTIVYMVLWSTQKFGNIILADKKEPPLDIW